jgi:hypothetical protein
MIRESCINISNCWSSKLIGLKINFVQTVSNALRPRLPDIDKSTATTT